MANTHLTSPVVTRPRSSTRRRLFGISTCLAAALVALPVGSVAAGWVDPPVHVDAVDGDPSRSDVEVVLLDNGRAVAVWRSEGDTGGTLQASYRDPAEAWSAPVSLGDVGKLYRFAVATNGVEVVVVAGVGSTFENVDIDLVAFELDGGSETWSAGADIQSLVGVGPSSLPPFHIAVGDDGIVTVATSTDPGPGPNGASLIQRIGDVWGAPFAFVTPTPDRGLHLPADDGLGLGLSHVGGVSRVTVAAATIDRGADDELNTTDDVYELLAVTATGDGGWSSIQSVHDSTGASSEFGVTYREIAVAAAAGDAVISWTDTDPSAAHVLNARVRLAAGSLSAEQEVSDDVSTGSPLFAAGAESSTNDVGVLWTGSFDGSVRLRTWDASTDAWETEVVVMAGPGGDGSSAARDLVAGPSGEMVAVVVTDSGFVTRNRSAAGVLAGSTIALSSPAATPGMQCCNTPSIAIGGTSGVERLAVVGSAYGSSSGMFVIDDDTVAPVITSASVGIVSGGRVAATMTASDNLGIRSVRFAWGDATADTVGTSTSAQHTYAASGTYTVTITVTDTASNVTSTTRSVTVTVATAPSAPRALVGTPRNASVSLAWAAPVSTGGATITDYVVQFRRTGTTSWTTFADGVRTTRTAVVTGLVNGRSYQFRVSAKNSVGTGAASATVTATPRTVPGVPRSVAVSTARGALVVSWRAPSSDGGSAITDYKIQRRVAGAKKWKTVKDGVRTTTSVRLTDLPAGTDQEFRVRAVSSVGAGAWSAVAEGSVPR
jgi:PKD repeat protein